MQRIIRGLFVLAATIMLAVPAGFAKAQDKKLVVTTFYPVYFLADYIAGDTAEVIMLLDGGQDAHSYESSAQDAVIVQEADLFIYQDDELEFFVQNLLNLIDTNETQVLQSTEGLELLGSSHHEEEHDESEGHSHDYDPHTWLDPEVYAQQAHNVRDVLITVDPDNQAVYESNTEALVQALEELDQRYTSELESLENRTIVVQHAAFGYLANAYNLEQEAITGLSTSSEPSAQQLAQIQDFINEHNVSVMYVDPSISTDISQTVAAATGAELRPLRTIEIVSLEEMEQGVDYFSIMEDNLAQLIQ